VQTSWKYEREQHVAALKLLSLNALVFGNAATLALTGCVVVLTMRPEQLQWGAGLGPNDVRALMSSVAAAASTAFLIQFARVTVRISSRDISARMFAWAVRAIVLVVVADVGLYFVFQADIGSASHAILLGLFAGGLGDQAILLLLDKAAAFFKTPSQQTAVPSPLRAFEGMTPEHVQRLEEEGIFSVHDLALVPTPRLFFSTQYSLQHIVDWQDRALLLVYIGEPGAKALEQKARILGAIDLRSTAHRALYGGGAQEAVKKSANDGAGVHNQDWVALSKSLGLEDAPLEELLRSIAHDEVVMRLVLYRQGTVTHDQPGPQRVEAGDGWVPSAREVVTMATFVERYREAWSRPPRHDARSASGRERLHGGGAAEEDDGADG
jgi:hypothetical protein